MKVVFVTLYESQLGDVKWGKTKSSWAQSLKSRILVSPQSSTPPAGQMWTPSLWASKTHGGCASSPLKFTPSWKTGTWRTTREWWGFWTPPTDFCPDLCVPSNTWRSCLDWRQRWELKMLTMMCCFIPWFTFSLLSLVAGNHVDAKGGQRNDWCRV